jgi:hypothetical protein
MKKRIIGQLVLLFFLGLFSLEALSLTADEFSKDKALEHLKYLAGTIGPRPLGSPQEKAALTYAAEKLAEYGCQVEWQPVTQSKRLNTSSFNVFARFPGLTAREIIIGAHIDSASPEIPGADDDGSGVAAILELARVLCQEKHQSTLVFVAFCGEEEGLIGSEYFAEHYPLKNVALMLQLDMTSDDSPLMLWIDTKKHQSPEWLVKASIDVFHSLGYRNIDYPTHFQSINGAIQGAGSDHEPFMEKGIPAIAFVSDVRFPIHTPNDSLEYFKPDGLERSGRLILELVRKFDREQPKEKDGHYMLVMLGEKPIFIHPPLIVAFVVLSLIVGVFALFRLYRVRKTRINLAEDKKIRKSWPKLLVLQIIIVIVTFASLWLMQLLKARRFPWYAHPGFYFIYAFLFTIFGIWLALQVLWKWRLRKNAFFYLIRAAIYLFILILLAWVLTGPRLALYPAAGLFLISLGCLVPWAWLKGLLWILSPYMMFRLLILPEYYEFTYRGITAAFSLIKTFVPSLIVIVVLILFFILWSMPFLLGFAAVYSSYSGDVFWLKRFRRIISIVPIVILIIGGAVYLSTQPSYTSIWEQEVSVIQKYDGEENKTSIEFSSSDYLREIKANINGKEETVDLRKCLKKIDYPLEMNWLKDKITSQVEEKGADKLISLKSLLDFEKQPYTVSLKLKSDKAFKIEESNVKYSKSKKNANIRWHSFPQRSLLSELKLRLPKGAELSAEIFASFLDTPIPISCAGKNKHFIYRAQITRKLDLLK